MNMIYLGLGSNLGDRETNLAKALQALAHKVTIGSVSSIYETEPVGYHNQPWFLNMVCRGTTHLAPFDLLSFAKEIETQLGRVPSFPNAPRPIDIDILFYDDQVIKTETLTIPHPRINERTFVLVPLAEIAPDLVHPVSRLSIADLLATLADSQQIKEVGRCIEYQSSSTSMRRII